MKNKAAEDMQKYAKNMRKNEISTTVTTTKKQIVKNANSNQHSMSLKRKQQEKKMKNP